MNKIEEVYSIFQDFFGEKFVDLQDRTILVMFPRTTITNENGRSTEIGKMFAKVRITDNGTIVGTFQLLRTEFSELHFRSGYVHSHVPSMSKNFSDVKSFRNPCLGNGPIKDTCAELNIEFDEDRWRLFCYELSKYVTVESLAGGPHYRMETIGSRDIFSNGYSRWIEQSYEFNMAESVKDAYRNITSRFVTYILSRGVLPLSYGNRFYSIALSHYELVIVLSNLFIEWYNTLPNSEKPEVTSETYVTEDDLWFEGKVYHGKIFRKNQYYRREYGTTLEEYVGLPMVMFKGIMQRLEIPDLVVGNCEDEATSILLRKSFISDVVNRLVKIINYGFIRNTTNRSEDGSYSTYIGEDTEVIF